MKLRTLVLPACVCIATARAETNISLTDIINQLPSCATSCVENILITVPGILTNPRIICGNVTLESSLSACVQGSCNYTEQAELSAINYKLCDGVPVESRSWTVTIVGLVCAPAALIAVILRCYARLSTLRRLGGDDWIIMGAAMLLVALIVLYIINCQKNGIGRHIFNLNPELAISGFEIFYACEILYILVITLVKSSILVFYLRIFPSRWFRITDLVLLVTVVGIGLAASLAAAFQCTPISGAWNRTNGAQCINLNVLAYATGGIFVAQDIAILILPIPSCVALQMGTKMKLNVLFMFGIGAIACIVSIVRLKYLVTFANSYDLTWDNAIPSIWSFVEICVATICACLPALRTLLSRWLPAVFAFSSSNSNRERLPHPYTVTNNSIHLDKVGPSYSKRAIATPEEELLSAALPRFGERKEELKIWIDQKSSKQAHKSNSDNEGSERSPRGSAKDSDVFELV